MSIDPARDIGDFVRPINKSGMKCPFDGKPVEKKCHTCELWQPIEVVVDGKPVVQWRCALVWPAVLGVIQTFKQDAIQAATERVRNEMQGFRGSVGQLVQMLGNASEVAIEQQRADDGQKALEVLDAKASEPDAVAANGSQTDGSGAGPAS